jgi:hypothetical protein
MTPTEFATYAKAWPSVVALATDLGIHRGAVYRYLDGSRSVPKPTARLIRILSRMPQARDAMHA